MARPTDGDGLSSFTRNEKASMRNAMRLVYQGNPLYRRHFRSGGGG